MKQTLIKTPYFCVFFILIISGCCSNIPDTQFYLTKEQKEAIPYSLNQKQSFVTNNGFEFDIVVREKSQFMKAVKFAEESCSYDEYETIETTIQSIHPELNILIKSSVPYEFNQEALYDLSIEINNKQFMPQCNETEYLIYDFKDTTINGKLYHNAMVFEQCYDYTNNGDSTAIYFDKILYTKKNGIELITFTNTDYYERKQN
jgi:hypothetical protein